MVVVLVDSVVCGLGAVMLVVYGLVYVYGAVVVI